MHKVLILFYTVVSLTLNLEAQASLGAGSFQSFATVRNYLLPSLSNSLSAFYTGKSTNSNWAWGQSSCWMPQGYTGWIAVDGIYGSSMGFCVALIAPSHAITAAHAGVNYSNQIVFRGTSGTLYTNTGVSAAFSGSDDMEVITLTSSVPADVTPASVFPANVTNYVPAGSFYGVNVAWLHRNTDRMNATYLINATTDYQCDLNEFGGSAAISSASQWYDGPATGGDSASPVFGALGSTMILMFCTYSTAVTGPFISCPSRLSWIQSQLGSEHLTFVDLSDYSTVP